MTDSRREQMKALLKTVPVDGRTKDPYTGTKIGRWLTLNPEALQFLELWLDMVGAGDSQWSFKKVHRHFVEEYRCPATTESLRTFCKKIAPEKYQVAMMGAAGR